VTKSHDCIVKNVKEKKITERSENDKRKDEERTFAWTITRFVVRKLYVDPLFRGCKLIV